MENMENFAINVIQQEVIVFGIDCKNYLKMIKRFKHCLKDTANL